MEDSLLHMMGIKRDDITDTELPVSMRKPEVRRRKRASKNDAQIHSKIDVDFYGSLRNNWIMRYVSCLYISLVVATISFASYRTSYDSAFFYAQQTLYLELALTPNLPFCEPPFVATQYMAQGASAMAHLPYVPSLLLGISYASPELMPALNVHSNIYASENRALLWLQFSLHLFTSVGGHMLPNPRAVFCQEISIALAFALLYKIFALTTTESAKRRIGARNVTAFVTACIIGYLTVGLMPIIFTCFLLVVVMQFVVKDSFGLITPHGRRVLLYIFGVASTVLVLETVCCDWLFQHVSSKCPYHLLFDLLFWQVLGSAVDVVVLSPRPSKFLLASGEPTVSA
jgi:hypothetical protein